MRNPEYEELGTDQELLHHLDDDSHHKDAIHHFVLPLYAKGTTTGCLICGLYPFSPSQRILSWRWLVCLVPDDVLWHVLVARMLLDGVVHRAELLQKRKWVVTTQGNR